MNHKGAAVPPPGERAAEERPLNQLYLHTRTRREVDSPARCTMVEREGTKEQARFDSGMEEDIQD